MNSSSLYRRTVPSPIGTINVVATGSATGTLTGGAIVGILWDAAAAVSDGDAHNPVERQFSGRTIIDATPGDHDILDLAVIQLEEYFAGNRIDFDLPLEPGGTAFQQQAWATLRTIPFGETITYGRQAAEMGNARKARAVGSANGQNPIPIVVPCHRVIGSTGKLTGFAGGLGVKAWLLEHERFTLMRR